MIDKIAEFSLDTRDWGTIKILRPYPTPISEDEEDPWGQLSILKGTPWGDQLPIVSGEVFSHATHGHATPLMRVIGPPPEALLTKIQKKYRVCASSKNCIIYDPKVCHPCKKMPGCYVPPGVNEEVAEAVGVVLAAWQEGRYVVIVEGPEFGY